MTGGMDVTVIGRSLEARRVTGFLTPFLSKLQVQVEEKFLSDKFVWFLAIPSKAELYAQCGRLCTCLGSCKLIFLSCGGIVIGLRSS